MGEFPSLQALALDLAATAGQSNCELAARAERVAARLAAGTFHIAVVGEFKRGKSTLVNALLGAAVLPSGVLPLTAVVTEVRYGVAGATVTELEGRRREIELGQLADYVTEAGNPENRRGIDRAEVRWPAELLADGIVLVDTPGIGSVYLHNSAVGRASLLEADGAVLVLSADAPLSDQERDLLSTLADRGVRTFVVVNKADHLDGRDLEQVRGFVQLAIADAIGSDPDLFFVAARQAVAPRVREPGTAACALEWKRFTAALWHFAKFELVAARPAAAREELGRVAEELRDRVLIRSAASELDVATLGSRVEQFRAAAAAQQHSFDEDRELLTHRTEELASRVRAELREFARCEPPKLQSRLFEEAARCSAGELEDGLRSAIESLVRERFEAFRNLESARVERDWQVVAEGFRQRTQDRVNVVREAASDLLAIELPVVTVPIVAEEREQFFYLFVHVGSSTESFGRLVRRMMPSSVIRRRSLVQARDQLAREFDKHAGRAGWDLAQRLHAVCARYSTSMQTELDRAIDGIVQAAARAEQLRAATAKERERLGRSDAEALRAIERVLSHRAGAHDAPAVMPEPQRKELSR